MALIYRASWTSRPRDCVPLLRSSSKP